MDDDALQNARVLLLEDDPVWVTMLQKNLDDMSVYILAATSLEEALRLLGEHYLNVALVDISLRLNDSRDEGGFAFLKAISDLGLSDVIRPVAITGYGNVKWARNAFHDYGVVDFIEKEDYTPERLREALAEALRKLNLDHSMEIKTADGHDICELREEFDWSRRIPQEEFAPEFRHLLQRLFAHACELFIERLPAGQSGAGVLKVEPTFFDGGVGAASIVKFGKKDKIRIEAENYQRYIADYVGAQSATHLESVLQREMGGIKYSFMGTELDAMQDFATFYAAHTVEDVLAVLNNLFRVTCGRWYDNRDRNRRRNLVQIYEQGQHLRWEEVRAGMDAVKDAVIARETIQFPGVVQAYPNPLTLLEERNFTVHMLVWQAITHGDMNEHNILVTEDGRTWLIDFYRSGPCHILRDIVELETAIKFSLLPDMHLDAYRRFEERLLAQQVLGELPLPAEDDPLHKPLAAIAYLRRLADTYTGAREDMEEYNWALFLQTLKVVSLAGIDADKRRRALLSACMLCNWLAGERA